MQDVVGTDAPPEFRGGMDYWERSQDPWHRDAFPPEYKDAIPHDAGERRDGWMAIDYAGNAIGFVPDGSECKLADDFTIQAGPYKHNCAMRPNTRYTD